MAQYAKTPEVRRGIVEACLSLFGRTGFHATSMAEIAREAGISHTGLVHHFPRKEDLLTAVLDLQDQYSAAYLSAHASLTPDADPLTVLRGMMNTLVEHDQWAGLVEFSTVLTGEATAIDHPAHDYFTSRYRSIRSFMTRQFTQLRDQGRILTGTPPERLAAVLIAATDGLRTQWLFDRDSVDVDACVSDILFAFVADDSAQRAAPSSGS